ncbi:MAG TPA: hypothetical protein VKU86_03590 [Acidimicrobiales bacterium]|nr:hypothetical protein [Acidimicrobiales bacterium]
MAVPGVLGIVRQDRVSLLHRLAAVVIDVVSRVRIPMVRAGAPSGTTEQTAPRARPDAVRRWHSPVLAPPGAFRDRAVADGLLTSDLVPRPGDTWDCVFDFALSYDGNAYWDGLSVLAARIHTTWRRDESLPGELGALRACLFHEQRRWHHFGSEPDGRSAAYIWALVDAIRAHPAVRTGEPPPPTSTLTSPTAAPAARDELRRPRHGRIELVLRAEVGSEGDEPAAAPVVALRPATARQRAEAGPCTDVRVVALPAVNALAGDAAVAPTQGAPASRRAHPSMGRVGAASAVAPEVRPRPATVVALEGERGARAFTRDDPRLRRWMTAHSDGYVLNVRRRSATAATLHRVGCPALVASDRGASPGAPVVCASDVAPVRAWAKAELGLLPTTCRRCRPG